jgi:hypothetical protein
VVADNSFPSLSLRAWPEHHGGGGDTTAVALARVGDRRKRCGNGRSELQPMPRAARRGKVA